MVRSIVFTAITNRSWADQVYVVPAPLIVKLVEVNTKLYGVPVDIYVNPIVPVNDEVILNDKKHIG
jgi:hypothetical protein